MAQKAITHFRSKRKTIEQRLAEGKALRNKFPRKDLGIYTPATKRADPVAILEAQGKTRLQDLVPIRYARMLTSPFAFLRGAAAIMAADLANSKTTGIQVQACGDMHIANFGVFASAERKLIFGINDFDETLPGPWEWDLKRLVASIAVGGKFLGADERLVQQAIKGAVKSYRTHLKDFAYMGNLELWYNTMTEDVIMKTLSPAQQKAFAKMNSKARSRTHMQVLDKLTDIVDDKYRLKVNAPFIVRETRTMKGTPIVDALATLLESYMVSLADDRRALLMQYRIVDVARKVVGVGSVGTRCWIIFLVGNQDGDPLFLQVKEAQPSVLEPFNLKSKYKNQGQRVVSGQRLIQGAPDIFLGWGVAEGFHFYVRQLRDMKGGAELDPATAKLEHFVAYCELCAWAMALSHAKSGDAALLYGYMGKSDELDKAMVNFGLAYADQNQKDYDALVVAAKNKRIKVAKSETDAV